VEPFPLTGREIALVKVVQKLLKARIGARLLFGHGFGMRGFFLNPTSDSLREGELKITNYRKKVCPNVP